MARAGLDRERVIACAAELADQDGLAAVTLARLAQALGVKPPSLYNHIGGMPALLDALTLRAALDLLRLSEQAMLGQSGDQALAALAQVQRAYAKAHPGLYAASFRSLEGKGPDAESLGARTLALFLALLRGYGLEGDDAIHMIRCLRAAISGFISLELSGGFGLDLDIDDSFERLLGLLAAGIQVARAAR